MLSNVLPRRLVRLGEDVERYSLHAQIENRGLRGESDAVGRDEFDRALEIDNPGTLLVV